MITKTLILVVLAGATASYLSEVEPQIIEIETVAPAITYQPETGGTEVDIEIPKATFTFPIAAEDWKITSPFGARISPRFRLLRHHNGVDISVDDARAGMPQIVSIADGVIRDNCLGNCPGNEDSGRYVVIEHDNGMVSSYAHLSVSYIHEWRSDGGPWRIRAGEVIGRMGSTGLAYGAHLHFELEINGALVNPMLYIGQVLPEWEENNDE